ncbi:MAG: hypothetical protein DRN04_08220 [Thermoprotei archaeon]|nr:MAG: hypothetical protein DRN04_08220 [Thermoprotei archaeon]
MHRVKDIYAREVFGYVYAPGKTFVELIVLVTDLSRALPKVIEKLCENGIEAEEIGTGVAVKGFRPLFIIAELVESFESVEKAADEIDSLPEVIKVEYYVKRADPEVRFSRAFPLVYHGTLRRAVLFDAEHFSKGMAVIKERWGDEGKALLFLLGRTWGLTLAELDAAKRVKFFSEVDVLKRFSAIWMFTGRGYVFKIEEIEPREYYIEILDNFEAICCRKEGEPSCHWTRGYLAGYLEGGLKSRYRVEEVECLSAGDDKCIFHIVKE